MSERSDSPHPGANGQGAVAVAVSVQPHRRGLDARVATRADVVTATIPVEGPLVDRYGRIHDDLRISVTDRCNLRCVYCMPEEGMTFLPRSELLTYEEIARVARVARDLGVRSIRLTGGEPLVRKDLCTLVSQLCAMGFDDLALTTNGMLLAPLAQKLADAGLKRVNVSCDSLRADRFESIRRRGDLATVLGSMGAAEAAGLTPLKVNVVLLRGNHDEIGRASRRERAYISVVAGSSRRRHTRCLSDWSSDVCSSDLVLGSMGAAEAAGLTPLKVNVVLLRGNND